MTKDQRLLHADMKKYGTGFVDAVENIYDSHPNIDWGDMLRELRSMKHQRSEMEI